jgi:DNA-binding NarL/FixJ family response regulator
MANAPAPIRVLLADDHAMVRAGLKELLLATGDIVVTAEAVDGHQVLDAVRTQALDVAVLDLTMPGRSGIELIKLVKTERPSVRVLVLSMHSEQQYAVRAVRAGASGYLTKESAPDMLVAAIRRIAAGGAFISPETAERLVLDANTGDAAPHTALSDREFEVFRKIVAGQSVSEIASALNLSVKTISTHKTRILEKMGMSSQAELVRYALSHGLIDDTGP